MSANPVDAPPRILVVDDQAGMRLSLKSILAKKGYQVSMADSGETALEAVVNEEFELIFMDIKMPGMSGVETLIEIKRFKPDAAVIMMTAYAVEDDIRRAIREGAYAVLSKPFDVDRLLEIIDECLQDRTLVMVVDDRVQDRQLLRDLLERKGYRVVDAESGEDCLREVKERRFQIILLDVRLPGIDGLQTLRQVKEIRPEVAVVMVTGYPAEDLVREAIEYGSTAMLNKPYDVEKLMDVVDQCLAKLKKRKRK